jgi:hypothetical protein
MLKQKQKDKLKQYTIPVKWTMADEIEVEAYSLEEAIEVVKRMPLTRGEYVEGTFEVDTHLLYMLNPHELDE